MHFFFLFNKMLLLVHKKKKKLVEWCGCWFDCKNMCIFRIKKGARSVHGNTLPISSQSDFITSLPINIMKSNGSLLLREAFSSCHTRWNLDWLGMGLVVTETHVGLSWSHVLELVREVSYFQHLLISWISLVRVSSQITH